MTWIKANWRWAALNITAAATLVLVVTQGSTRIELPGKFDSIIETGKWALRLMLVCLSMTPLNTYFGWKHGIGLRKSAGLWAAGFAGTHFLLSTNENQFGYYKYELPLFVLMGFTALTVLAMLAATSNRWAMKWLGKTWKRLHRLVYAAGALIATHAFLALGSTKRMAMESDSSVELTAYAVILAALLVARIPAVRQVIQQGVIRRVPRGEAL
jgi:methionine sulfoxide reductase heme-binding subunit